MLIDNYMGQIVTRSNMPMQPTPLCGPKIVAILKAGFVPRAFPIYTTARLMGRPLGGSLQCQY